MRRVIVTLVTLTLLAPAVPAVGAAPGQELRRAEHDLQAVVERLQRAREAYAAAQDRLSDLRARLGAIERQLVEAQASEREAQAAQQHAEEAARSSAELLQLRRDQLSGRATEIYKSRGSDDPIVVIASALGTARDAHDLALAAVVGRRLLAGDHELIQAARDLQRRADIAVEEAAAATRAAEQRRAAVEEISNQQRQVVADADDERASLRAIVEELAADRAARQQLVVELKRRLRSVEAVLRTPQMLPFDQPAPGWSARLPAAGKHWAGAVDAAATRAGIDGRFFAALVWTESSFRPDVVSPGGAVGLAQLMPATAQALGVDPWDPLDNLSGGARYLHAQLIRFWNLELGLAAYNAGPTRVAEAGAIPEVVETQLYVLAVLDRWEHLRG